MGSSMGGFASVPTRILSYPMEALLDKVGVF